MKDGGSSSSSVRVTSAAVLVSGLVVESRKASGPSREMKQLRYNSSARPCSGKQTSRQSSKGNGSAVIHHDHHQQQQLQQQLQHYIRCIFALSCCMQALPIFLDKLLDPVTAVLLSVTVVLVIGEWGGL